MILSKSLLRFTDHKEISPMKKNLFIFTLFFSLILSFPIWGTQSITIGSKTFSEQLILGEMLALILEEKYDLKVIRKFNLGGTQVVFDALKRDDIQIYPEYTGTGYITILKRKKILTPKETYSIVQSEFKKRFNIIWSPPLGFNNTYAFTVRNDDPRFKDVSKISELSHKMKNISIAIPHEFMEREDGFPNFTKTYSLNFDSSNIYTMDSGLTYKSIINKQVDSIISYSTDGRIHGYNLKVLEDDKLFFPPYFVSFIVQEKTLQKWPAISRAFQLLKNQITDKEMTELNHQVDLAKEEPQKVAYDFLLKKKIIKKIDRLEKTRSSDSLLTFFYEKRSYLGKLIKEHLILSFGALFMAMLIAIPTGILLTRYKKFSVPIFALINTFQTIPSIALLGFLVPLVGIGIKPAMTALFLYSLLPLVQNTYTGIKNINPIYIDISKGLGLTNWQILKHVEIPLAMPIILAGIRTSTVIVIGTATLAALVGGGGLGDPIFRGTSTLHPHLILLGAIPSALLAILADKILSFSELFLVSKGLRLKKH